MDARTIVVQARDGEGGCPYCREVLVAGEAVLVCEACAVAYHADCMRQELGRCATLGCTGKRALPREFGRTAPAQVVTPAPVAPSVASSPRDRVIGGLRALLGGLVAVVGIITALLALDTRPASDTTRFVIGLGVALALLGVAITLWSSTQAAPETTPRCRRCRVLFARGARVLRCEGCGERYHPRCLELGGRCETAACTGQRARPARA